MIECLAAQQLNIVPATIAVQGKSAEILTVTQPDWIVVNRHPIMPPRKKWRDFTVALRCGLRVNIPNAVGDFPYLSGKRGCLPCCAIKISNNL